MKRTIKRYENRKLYDTKDGCYVSLRGIREMVRNGDEVEVIDNTNGEDITAQTLTQIILEEGKKGNNPFSSQLLHEAIRLGEVIDEGVERFKDQVDELLPDSINRWWKSQGNNEVNELKERVAHLETLLNDLYQKRDASRQSETGSDEK